MNSALIIVDMQNDFCQGGSLEVQNSNEIIPLINKINLEMGNKFKLRILTKDWHPVEHISFIGNNLESHLVNPSEMTLKWKSAFPKHCIQGTVGAEIHPEIKIYDDFIYVNKGYDPLEEAFSGFLNPELNKILLEKKIEKVLVIGLAYDFCVAHTAFDSAKLGYFTYILKDACRQISDASANEAEEIFQKLNVNIINYEDLQKIF